MASIHQTDITLDLPVSEYYIILQGITLSFEVTKQSPASKLVTLLEAAAIHFNLKKKFRIGLPFL